jgi:hypothetical protein
VPRYLVQSAVTGRFLCPSPRGDEPVWVRSLREAGGGVITDLDACHMLIIDNCDPDDRAFVVDLERLGTVNDYQ